MQGIGGSSPDIVPSRAEAGQSDQRGAMEDILRVHFCVALDHPTVLDLDFGVILTRRPEFLNNAGIAAGTPPQPSAGATGTQGPTGGGGGVSASGSA